MNDKEYLFIVLMEECAEVAKAASKALRFGMLKYKPGSEETNRLHLIRELSEVVAVAELLGLKVNDSFKRDKVKKLEEYMEVSRDCGTLKREQES